MTLDPVHFDGIADLAGRISQGVEDRDHRAFAETVWSEFLDPLVVDGVRVLEPVASVRRRVVAIEDAALQDPPFPTRHGLDAGTINPTRFTNGLTLDVAQAAMAAVPSDLDLHRARTVVATVHANDATVGFDEGWTAWDQGYSRGRVLQTPRVDQYESTVVHELALYLAESQHALTQAEVVEDLLVLDGPVYPKGLLNWSRREPELAGLLDTEQPRSVVGNYLQLVETFVQRDVPLVGFVKSPLTRALTRTIRRQEGNAPWVNDAAFFARILEGVDDDRLTLTGWFVSRGGADRVVSRAGDALELPRDLAESAYEVCFFMLYDPRVDRVYRIETPFAFARDEDRRERIVRQVLAGVAAERGPPPVVAKADGLAKIGRRETAALRDAIDERIDADRDTDYGEDRAAGWLGIE